MFVLDTNTVIHFFRGEGGIGRRLVEVPPSQVAIPSIVVYELETGIARSSDSSKRRRQLDQLLEVIPVLPFGVAEAKAAAAIRAVLAGSGTPIGPMDTLIAGVATAHAGVLVTRNLREFRRVRGLMVQDWYRSGSS